VWGRRPSLFGRGIRQSCNAGVGLVILELNEPQAWARISPGKRIHVHLNKMKGVVQKGMDKGFLKDGKRTGKGLTLKMSHM